MKTTQSNLLILFPSLFVLMLGGAVLFGWFSGISLLTQVYPAWKPMVPATALCFMLSGVALLVNRYGSGRSVLAKPQIYLWLTLAIAFIRLFELVSGRTYGIEFLLGLFRPGIGHMSPQTVAGFLMFGIGMLALLRSSSTWTTRAVGMVSAFMLGASLLGMVAYLLRFNLVFEDIYLQTGGLWMSFHTALGMFLLALGLVCVTLKCRISDEREPPVERTAKKIYRTTLLVLLVTSLTAGLVGIAFLEQVLEQEGALTLEQLIRTRVMFFSTNLDNRTQRALVASQAPEFRALAGASDGAALSHAEREAGMLLQHGFTGISFANGNRKVLLAGYMLPASVQSAAIQDYANVSLAWRGGYILRVQVPLARPGRAGQASLIFEQALPLMDKMFAEANQYGETGILALCARLDAQQLLCFPQREQQAMYVIPDDFDGKPIPMALALDNSSGVAELVDYRGRNVLSAYAPIPSTGLGLVQRMDLAEILSPIRSELSIALPLILIMALVGLYIIHSRVRPLITGITDAYAAENLAKERFDAAMQSSPDGFVIYESFRNNEGDIVDFRCVYLNQNAEYMAGLALLGKTAKNLVGRTFLEVFPERTEAFELYRSTAASGKLHTEELPLPGENGTTSWYLRQLVPMPRGLAVTYRNITEHKMLVQQLQLSNQLREAIVEGAAYAIISTDVDGTIRTFNNAAERMLWYHADELVGKATPQVFHDAEEVRERAITLSQELGREIEPGFEVFIAKPKMEFREDREWTYVRKDGSRVPVRLSVTVLRNDDNSLDGFLGIAYDISEQKRAEEYIRHIALHDVLTGLPNRALLDDRVQQAIEQQRRYSTPFALAMMDIDRFKHINDSMGHHIGDMILKEFVRRIKSCLRPTDTLARMGGDEFVLLLSDSDADGVAVVMERIQNALLPPVDVDIKEVHITSSIGISLSPRDGDNVNELMRRADVAMYWVKENGRNGYRIYSQSMERGGTDRLNLERELHIALEKNGFTLFYQPQLNLATGAVIGLEALIRMRRQDGVQVPPSDFIPLAEDLGLIVPIGKWVLETACNDLARLQSTLGVPLAVAVNISPRQFMNSDLSGAVKEVLKQTQIDPAMLELEITEGVLMDERNNVSTTLSNLHELGVKIAIDDFGTGYSSLSYLKRFPISTIKIDQSFVRDITSDSEDAHLVNAIISMGHSLNLPVIAEGVETAEQLNFLAAKKCDFAQGYYFGRPMPFDKLVQWFAERSAAKN